METVGARCRDFVDLGAAKTAQNCALKAGRDDGDGVDLVVAEGEVRGARVVQVEERIVLIAAVQGEHVRQAGDTEAREVAVSRQPRCRYSSPVPGAVWATIGEVVAGIGESAGPARTVDPVVRSPLVVFTISGAEVTSTDGQTP